MIITQTALKDFENPESCPTRLKGSWIDKTIPFPTNEHMDKGHFFEFLCLGGGANYQENVEDLPKTNTGKPTADEVRIRQQAEVFLEMFNPESDKFIGLTIIEKQIKLEWNDEQGTIDFICQDIITGEKRDADLKLCNDVTSTRTPYSWGNIDTMDLIQQVHYNQLYYKVRGERLKPILFVFDYSPAMRKARFDLELSETAYENADYRKQQLREVVEYYNTNGWTKLPSVNECDRCPLECDQRISKGMFDITRTITI